VDWLAVYAFPECCTFIIGKSIEEGLPECGFAVNWWGARSRARTMPMATMVVTVVFS
jgi:hypothetical protein